MRMFARFNGAIALAIVLVSVASSAEVKKSLSSSVAENVITWETEFEAALSTAKEENRPLLLYVSMEGCHYCDKMDRETYSDVEVAKDVTKSYIPVRVKRNQAPQLVRRYGIQIFPTTVIIHPNSNRIETIRGYVGASQFMSRLATNRANAIRR
jgi:uncharacterized protein YyaL (SSP411 family)